MKNLKLKSVLVFAVFILLCSICFILVKNALWYTKVAEIALPSGDKIIIEYYRSDEFLMGLAGIGGLRYSIISNGFRSSGRLTRDLFYDHISEANNLNHVIQGERRVMIDDRQPLFRSWIFEGDSSGKYEVIDLYKQRQGGEWEY